MAKNFLKKANYDIDQAVELFWHELNQFILDYIPCDIEWEDDSAIDESLVW